MRENSLQLREDSTHRARRAGDAAALRDAFAECRGRTVALTDGLSDADATVQSMNDASPAKWHLAHTTWFFEAFVLREAEPGAVPFDERYDYLFNSYYETIGARHPRPQRGMLTRPGMDSILRYREHVDRAVERWLSNAASHGPAAAGRLYERIELGIQHEQQHQELILTDLLHLFSRNPLAPAYRPVARTANDAGGVAAASAARYVAFEGGRYPAGHSGNGFAYDCEGPRHETLLLPFAIADRPVTNAEWCDFIEDGGYRTPLLWLSDGWDRVRLESWEAPLYWRLDDRDGWRTMTLHGERAPDPAAPVAHVSYYEADAYARWAGRRLPTEFEWEAAARHALRASGANDVDDEQPIRSGNFSETERFEPAPAAAAQPGHLRQMFGDVWEWTSSAFAAYPGFRPAAGAVGEYNGKFMCGQYVLRGGSCATPRGHVRSTYRNFFPPNARWQFSGVRLAEDRS